MLVIDIMKPGTRQNLTGKSTRGPGFSRVVENPIYIGESLTKQNKLLFNKCLHGYQEETWLQIYLDKDGEDMYEGKQKRACCINFFGQGFSNVTKFVKTVIYVLF